MIKVDLTRCTGCRMCETACAFAHTGRTNRNLSRITIVQLYDLGVDGPVVCVQCKERYCSNCPENAITHGHAGQVIVSPTACNLCDKCVNSCPIGAMHSFDEIIYVCDLCGGRVECVKACTEGALQYIPDETGTVSLSDFKKNVKKMNVSEKQANYINESSKDVRKKWRKQDA